MRPSRGMFGVVSFVLLMLMVFLLFSAFSGSAARVEWREFRLLAQQGQLEDNTIVIRDNGIYAVQRKGPDGSARRIVFPLSAGSKDFYRAQLDEVTAGNFTERPSSIVTSLLISLIPFILIIAIIWFFIARSLRSAGGGAGGMLGNFGKSKHRVLSKEMTGITFKDVAGIDEAKDEVSEIIEFLRNPKKFMRLGGRIPRGVLLVGPPGCGKTLLAKAIAGEADVPFFSISGSDFVEMFVGVGASRVRDLFKQAKESAPCIIFLDEIDAVGRRRGGGFSSGGNDEREQTLNAILVEMDGFNSTDGVIVIAATNRADVLDQALTRPGRFDRQIMVSLPDVKGRVEILNVHIKKIKHSPDVDIERLARATPMFSGADLAAMINEAAIAATMLSKDFVEMADLEEARDKVKFGRARKSRVRGKDDNKLTAYHEAGHAVLQMLLTDADPLHKVTIIPRGEMGGATFSLPDKDRMGYSLRWLRATLAMACGGRIAEEKAMGDVSTGAVGDIMQVTNIARSMVLEWGMSERLGFVRYAPVDSREMFVADKDYSDETARLIDEEIKRIVTEAYNHGRELLEANWGQVIAVAEALLKYETLDRSDVDKLMRGETLGKPTVSDLLAEEARRLRAEKAAAEGAGAAKTKDDAEDLPGGMLPSPA